MTDWVYHLDKSISHMSPNRRIIYFQSENRRMIRDAVNASAALRARLSVTAPKSEHLYEELVRQYQCMELTQVYQSNGVFGTIRLLTGKKKDTQESITIVPAVLTLTDFQVFAEADRGRMIKAFLDEEKLKDTMLLITSPQVLIPDGFSSEIELVTDNYISQNDICEKIHEQVRREEKLRDESVFTDEEIKQYAEAFVGLTAEQVQNVLDALQGELCTGLKKNRHQELIHRERLKEAQKDAAVQFIELEEEETVAGLGSYQLWLSKRVMDFANPALAKTSGIPAPKGVLLCGIPGTGKTAMARESARILKVPLIQFDISRIQDSKYGASEAKLRRYLNRISAFGSCVMLMDEIEKTFAVNDNTHEVKLAMLGLLLDWMQSRKANVLTFITANNISKLPPELLRDGRISGRFFAFMPSRDDLAAIMQLKLKPLAQTNLLNSEFKAILKDKPTDNRRYENELTEVLDQIAEEARAKSKAGDTRWPFMTGANMESLLEMTNRELREAKINKPYGVKVYMEQMRRCAASAEFVPQGQSNMQDIVTMWLKAQKCQYQDVSAHTLLPFSKFKDGVFTQKLCPDNAYDAFLVETVKEEIEKVCKKEREREEVLNRYAADSSKT